MVSYFNTKFVIAKLKKQSASMSWTSEFQYKICYSKIKLTFFKIASLIKISIQNLL